MRGASVSVVIPTRNAGSDFPRLLDVLPAERLPGPEGVAGAAEVLIVDSGSTDGTPDVARQRGIRVMGIHPSTFDHGGTRNAGARETGGEVIVFMTQDAMPDTPGFLGALTEGLGTDDGPDAAFARQVAGPGADPVELFSRAFNYPEEPALREREDLARIGLRACFFSNTASAVSRASFERLGGFREPIITNEDMEFAYRLLTSGGSIAYRPRARVVHRHQTTLGRRFSRYFDIGAFLSSIPELRASGAGTEGMRFLAFELKALIRSGRVLWVPYALLDAAARFLGVNLGRGQAVLPRAVVRVLSARPEFW